jgi:hypothetical protein
MPDATTAAKECSLNCTLIEIETKELRACSLFAQSCALQYREQLMSIPE